MDNSYFGVIGHTYYAGPNGASFQIKSAAKFGNYRELLANVENRASILIGDYMVVNYGSQAQPNNTTFAPNGKSYNTNLAIDAYTGSGPDPGDGSAGSRLSSPGYYNATIWQKTGIGEYELVFGCVSAAPNIDFDRGTSIAPGDSQSDIIEKQNTNSPMNQIFTVHPIAPWNFEVAINELAANANPTASITDATGANATTHKKITFGIPQAWNFDENVTIDPIDPGESAYAIVNDDSANNKKQLQLGIPEPWDISLNAVSGDASADPSIELQNDGSMDTKTFNVTIPAPWNVELGDPIEVLPGMSNEAIVRLDQKEHSNSSDSATTKYLHFGIPKRSILGDSTFTIVGSTVEGNVTSGYASDNQTYSFNFTIPRGSRLKAGTELFNVASQGQEINVINSVLSGLLAGDFYINTTLGTVYEILQVINADNNEFRVKNVGAIQISGLTVNPVLTTPTYSVTRQNNEFTVTPSVNTSAINAVSPSSAQEQWRLNLPVVTFPVSKYNISLVDSTQNGSTDITVSNQNELNYNIQIPRGSRIFFGNDKTIALGDSVYGPGDYFFNTASRVLYKILNSQGDISNTQSVTLSGTSFSIYSRTNNNVTQTRWVVTESILQPSSTEDIIPLIKVWLSNQFAGLSDNELPQPFSQMVDVLYTDNNNNNISYWFYRTGNTLADWNAIRLSADSASSIIESVAWPNTANNSSTTYSTVWLNNLQSSVSSNTLALDTKTNSATVQSMIDAALANLNTEIYWGSWDSTGAITWNE